MHWACIVGSASFISRATSLLLLHGDEAFPASLTSMQPSAVLLCSELLFLVPVKPPAWLPARLGSFHPLTELLQTHRCCPWARHWSLPGRVCAAKQQGLEARPLCLFSALAHRSRKLAGYSSGELPLVTAGGGADGGVCSCGDLWRTPRFPPAPDLGLATDCSAPALRQECSSEAASTRPWLFYGLLGCCFGEILGDELACTLRCQLELNSGQILSQNYVASLSKSPHSRLSQ